MSLKGILEAVRHARETAEVRAAYDEFLERLDAGEVAAQACKPCKPGSRIPGFLLPIPAAFLVGQDGVIRRAWVNIDFTQRAEPNDILHVLIGLQAHAGAPRPGHSINA